MLNDESLCQESCRWRKYLCIDVKINTDLMQKQCQCRLLHIQPSCRDYLDGKHCPDGAQCSLGHDRLGQNIRRRKADEHSKHHELLQPERSLVGLRGELRAVDGPGLKLPGSLSENTNGMERGGATFEDNGLCRVHGEG